MELITTNQSNIIQHNGSLVGIGQMANEIVNENVFGLYRTDKSVNTIKTHKRVVEQWGDYLLSVGASVGDMWADPSAWVGVTHGLVTGFKLWALAKGNAIGTISTWLKTVRRYALLASSAGHIPAHEAMLIKAVKISQNSKAKQNTDAKREKTRVGRKKAVANVLDEGQVKTIYRSIDTGTETGKRDKLIAHLMFEHGLRMGEILILSQSSFKRGTMTFDRPKVGLTDQTHKLTRNTKRALKAYKALGTDGPFLQSSKRGKKLSGRVLSQSSLKRIVKAWGEVVGVSNLSPHDARHTLATGLARKGYSAAQLLDFFGWGSLTTAQNYIERNKVGNEGIDSAW